MGWKEDRQRNPTTALPLPCRRREDMREVEDKGARTRRLDERRGGGGGGSEGGRVVECEERRRKAGNKQHAAEDIATADKVQRREWGEKAGEGGGECTKEKGKEKEAEKKE